MKTLLSAASWLLVANGLVACSPAIAPPARTGLPQDVQPATVSATVEPTAEASVEASLYEAEAGFRIRLPVDLPDGYQFQDAVFLPDVGGVTARYTWVDEGTTGETLFVTQQRLPPVPNVAPEARSERLPIGAAEGDYIQGDWFDGMWKDDAPVHRLRWEADGYHFTVLFVGNEESSAGYLSRDDLASLAEQIR